VNQTVTQLYRLPDNLLDFRSLNPRLSTGVVDVTVSSEKRVEYAELIVSYV